MPKLTVSQDPPVKQADIMADTSFPKSAATVPSSDVLVRRYHMLKRKHESRNARILHLLRLYESDPVSHDMRGETDSTEVIVNRIFDTVNTFVDFKGIPPNIHFYPPELTPEGKTYADDMEKYLYALYEYNSFEELWPRVTFDMGLFGYGNMGVLPTSKLDGFVEFRRFSPKNFYPQCYAGTNQVKYYFYESKYSKEEALEKWGAEALQNAGSSEIWRTIWPEGSVDPDECLVLEYCDEDWFIIMLMDKVVFSIQHKFGFCPAQIFPNIVKPDIVGGVSDVAMYESLQVYESQLFSIVADLISYWANPMLFVQSDRLGVEDIFLDGVTIGGPNDNAKFLEPSINFDVIDKQLNRTKQAFHDGTIPETLYGRVETKGALGSAPVLSGLQTKFMVRLNSIYRRSGSRLVKLNQMALEIAQKLYKNQKIEWDGWRRNKNFHLEMYGSRIQAFKRHRVFWDMSVTDPDRHLVMEIQKTGQRLQSKYRTMENLGLSPQDEFDLMRQEDIYEIRRQAALKVEAARLEARFQQPTMEETNREVLAGMKGGSKVYPTAEGGARPGPGRPSQGRGGREPGRRMEARAEMVGADVDRIVADLMAVKKVKGQVYLVGVDDTIDIAVTDKLDKGTIMKAPTMQAYRGRMVFIVVKPGQARPGWVAIKGGG